MIVLLKTILLTSCIKATEKEYGNVSDKMSDNSTSGRSEGYGYRGLILDLGIVEEFRVMQTLILTYNVSDGHPMDSNLADMERIQVKFYIKILFRILPSGEYFFRNTSSISSGTFDSASRTGGYLPDDEIVGGRIWLFIMILITGLIWIVFFYQEKHSIEAFQVILVRMMVIR